MCPRKWIYQSKFVMPSLSLLMISSEFKNAQNVGLLNKGCRIIFNFQNEPLLDKDLFRKIEIIKNSCDCNIDFYTNGTLVASRMEEILKYKHMLSGFIYSNYGENTKEWEYVTGVSISEKKFEEMKKALEVLSHKLNVRYWDAWRDGELFDFSTRAGLTRQVKIKTRVSKCNWVRPYNYINIHSNGDAVLCCQDWKRETKYGNAFNQSIISILQSGHYKHIQDQAIGTKESDANFVCKRCKWSE